MTNEQLTLDIQNGNRAALTELWGAVRPLLFSLAWRFYTRQGKDRCAQRGVALEDLQQEAFFALWDAVQAYKPEKGYQFTTYLSRATENRFRACMGMLHKADALNHADRLERPIPGDEEGREQGDTIPDEKAEAALLAVDDTAQREHFHNVLEQALGDLSVVQSAVLRHRFTQRHTRMETALALHITPQEVRREESKALQLLRGKPTVLHLREEVLETAAYHGTGWFSWYFDRGSVEERIIEQASKNKEE
ncbi:sigma-70 family RNA polymerase sigma factor [Acutalibacter sp. LFL-21]|uniref:sigma-70 family RNA polymerase sigma factor n=1 Tax=Acutalibacter sp. LFL-21 TaxID=2983399 RepID=UPI0021D65A09|nr:sigma-70 family RNA polymerase sigma factor [Acutalibacter sp. LFL-21]MCU7651393.1 sigma-70 family RNA polymerase sigma factor [Acutalibacter sp. LFL-21]